MPQGGDLALCESLRTVRRRQPPLDPHRIASDPTLPLSPADHRAHDGQFALDGVGIHLVCPPGGQLRQYFGQLQAVDTETETTGGLALRRACPVGADCPRYPRSVTRRHTSCYHTKYVLTCGEYDDLLRRADGHCALCKERPRPGRPLNIDHDHALGQWAVRGLVCDRCNQTLRRVEAGEYPNWLPVRLYIDNPWHATQLSSGVKATREKPRTACPTCGKSVAVHKNGSLARHTAIGRQGSKCWTGTCPGANGAPATVEIIQEKGSSVIPFQAARRPPKRS